MVEIELHELLCKINSTQVALGLIIMWARRNNLRLKTRFAKSFITIVVIIVIVDLLKKHHKNRQVSSAACNMQTLPSLINFYSSFILSEELVQLSAANWQCTAFATSSYTCAWWQLRFPCASILRVKFKIIHLRNSFNTPTRFNHTIRMQCKITTYLQSLAFQSENCSIKFCLRQSDIKWRYDKVYTKFYRRTSNIVVRL